MLRSRLLMEGADFSLTRLLVGIPDEDAAEPSPRKLIPLADRVEEARRFSVVHAGRPVLLIIFLRRGRSPLAA